MDTQRLDIVHQAIYPERRRVHGISGQPHTPEIEQHQSPEPVQATESTEILGRPPRSARQTHQRWAVADQTIGKFGSVVGREARHNSPYALVTHVDAAGPSAGREQVMRSDRQRVSEQHARAKPNPLIRDLPWSHHPLQPCVVRQAGRACIRRDERRSSSPNGASVNHVGKARARRLGPIS